MHKTSNLFPEGAYPWRRRHGANHDNGKQHGDESHPLPRGVGSGTAEVRGLCTVAASAAFHFNNLSTRCITRSRNEVHTERINSTPKITTEVNIHNVALTHAGCSATRRKPVRRPLPVQNPKCAPVCELSVFCRPAAATTERACQVTDALDNLAPTSANAASLARTIRTHDTKPKRCQIYRWATPYSTSDVLRKF